MKAVFNYGYSPGNNVFYPLPLKSDFQAADSWPDDVVGVADDVYFEFTGVKPAGKVRQADASGLPCWVDAPSKSKDECVSDAEAKKQVLIAQANITMNDKQWPGKAALGRLKGDELAQYGLWLDYLDALESVKTSLAPNIKWPEQPE
ncbi:tail fiber assembly protein [Yokenella regensburgei]|uniref:tail fiber assembly protein n=1 Tax=Yokenella regensburgei TaxID=158877 RepID=UPI003ED8D6DF